MALPFPHTKLAAKLLIMQIALSLVSTAVVGVVAYKISVSDVVNIANRYSGANLNKFIRQLENLDKDFVRTLVVKLNDEGIPAMAGGSPEADAYTDFRMKRALAETVAEIASLDGLLLRTRSGTTYAVSRASGQAWPKADGSAGDPGERPFWFRSEAYLYVRLKVYDIDTMNTTGELTARLSGSFVKEIEESGSSSVPGALLVMNPVQPSSLLTIGTSSISKEDEERAIALSLEEGRTVTRRLASGTFALSSLFSPDRRWRIVGIVGLAELEGLSSVIKIGILLAVLGALAFAFAVAILISRQLSTRIDGLTRSVKALARGDAAVPQVAAYSDELGALFDEFKAMATRTEALLERLSSNEHQVEEAQKKALRSEYAALRARLNPHFVSNSLEMINSIAKIRGQREISEALCSLGELVYDAARDGPERVPLDIELGHVERYFKVQNRLFDDEISLELDIAEDARQASVPDFILQPLVENAIVHGLGTRKHGGRITIRVAIEGEVLAISVEDNGVGMSEATLQAISDGKSASKGFGLASVMERIGIVYGRSRYGLSARSERGRGTVVRLSLPAREDT
jgi:two-component system, sensor histidine kinase YesM